MVRRRCGVLGSPIAHSLSPTLHRAAYAALGLDWQYDAHDVDEAGLPAFVAGLGSEWRGLSLTMPLKSAAVGLCSSVDDQSRTVGAVNTVLVEAPGRLVGLNTDVPGFVAAWRSAGVATPARRLRTAAVVGAGATARSALAALADIGACDVSLIVRSPVRATHAFALAKRLGLSASVVGWSEEWAFPEVDLLVSTLPDGALVGAPVALVDALVVKAGAVCDVVYDPRLTPLLAAARRFGLPCVEGFDLLLHQAALQVEAMAGAGAAPIERMRSAGLAELGRRERIA